MSVIIRSLWISIVLTCLPGMLRAAAPGDAPVVLPQAVQFEIPGSTGDAYRIYLAGPKGEAPADGWPVIYFTDANTNFPVMLSALQKQSRGGLGAVLVGIGYPSEDAAANQLRRAYDLTPVTSEEWRTQRAPQFAVRQTGGNERFLTFIQKDLKPAIEKRYPINRQQQALLGHSFGGLFVLDTLFRHPEAFQTYVAISPSLWWNDNSIRADEEAFLKQFKGQKLPVRVLVCCGELEVAPIPSDKVSPNGTVAGKEVVDRLTAGSIEGLHAEFVEFAGEDHGSVVLPAASRGVRFALPGSGGPRVRPGRGTSGKSDVKPPFKAPAAAKEPRRFEGTLAANSLTRHAFDSMAGDYFHGTLKGRGLTLLLLTPRGEPIRTLTTGRGDEQEFLFVAEGNGTYGFQVQGADNEAYVLTLDAPISAAEQVAPPKVLESPRLRNLEAELRQGGTTETFWKDIYEHGAPLVETEDVVPPVAKGMALVTFLWRGARSGVKLFAAPTNDHEDLQRLGASDVWFASYRVPTTTRMDYKLAPDVPQLNASPWIRRRAILTTAQRDPLNPKAFPATGLTDRFAGNSVLELSEAPPAPWLERKAEIPAGQVEIHRVESKILGNTRDVALYKPVGYRPGAVGNALLVVFDGDKYRDDIPTPVILDNLIAAGKIPPTAAVLISNPTSETRSRELPCNPEFAKFLAEELMPWAREQGAFAEASRTVIAGASYGGLASAYAGFTHPELFGNVYSQSGSFWWSPAADGMTEVEEPEWLTREFVAAERRPVRFRLEAGVFEVGQRGSTGILSATRHLRDVLRAKGCTVSYAEFTGGHGYFCWRYPFAEGLITLLGTPAAVQQSSVQ